MGNAWLTCERYAVENTAHTYRLQCRSDKPCQEFLSVPSTSSLCRLFPCEHRSTPYLDIPRQRKGRQHWVCYTVMLSVWSSLGEWRNTRGWHKRVESGRNGKMTERKKVPYFQQYCRNVLAKCFHCLHCGLEAVHGDLSGVRSMLMAQNYI